MIFKGIAVLLYVVLIRQERGILDTKEREMLDKYIRKVMITVVLLWGIVEAVCDVVLTDFSTLFLNE